MVHDDILARHPTTKAVLVRVHPQHARSLALLGRTAYVPVAGDPGSVAPSRCRGRSPLTGGLVHLAVTEGQAPRRVVDPRQRRSLAPRVSKAMNAM